MTNVSIEDAGELIAQNDALDAESALDLAKLLARLPENVRLSIRYVKVDGLSVAEAAIRCRISPSAVKINIHRGLKTLIAFIGRTKEMKSDKSG